MEEAQWFLANSTVVKFRKESLEPALDYIRETLGLKGTKEGCREGDCGACAVLLGKRDPHKKGSVRYDSVASCLLAMGALQGCHLVTIEGLAIPAPTLKDARYRYPIAEESFLGSNANMVTAGAVEAAAGIAGAATLGQAKAGSSKSGTPRETSPSTLPRLTPVMEAILEENASQCGFCTPGLVISLTAFLASKPITIEYGIEAIEGNICRCTGYGAIRRALERLVEQFCRLPEPGVERIDALVAENVLPESAARFARDENLLASSRLQMFMGSPASSGAEGGAGNGEARSEDIRPYGPNLFIAGGTDFFVQQPDPLGSLSSNQLDLVVLLDGRPELLGIHNDTARQLLDIGAATNVRDFFESPLVRQAFPGIAQAEELFASSLVRNRATLGGNLCNASSIADLSSMFIAMDAKLVIRGDTERTVAADKFFRGYKELDLLSSEILARILLPNKTAGVKFNFEKISKRKHLDIATVNTALCLEMDTHDGILPRIAHGRISAGGVAPVPILLSKTSALLEGAIVSRELVKQVCETASGEFSTISDIRGSASYRARIMRRLMAQHFVTLFPTMSMQEGTQ